MTTAPISFAMMDGLSLAAAETHATLITQCMDMKASKYVTYDYISCYHAFRVGSRFTSRHRQHSFAFKAAILQHL